MSYPRKIHTLIVEDEPVPIENYRSIFDSLAKQHDLVEPRFARSFEDAKRILAMPEILHLLILDLGLPLETRGEAMTGIDAGRSLLKLAAERDGYPIPALVVISGRLSIANLTELEGQLRQSFWHGTLVNKGVDEDDAIEQAIRAIHRYCDVGIHVHEAGGQLCPTLSPREEDLLRRCVLSQPERLGLDLEWWGKFQPRLTDSSGSKRDTATVLAGHFLLDRGMGSSQTSFFKFRSADGATYTRNDAEVMVQKLNHIKVMGAVTSSSRSLLVTQKVGDSTRPPVSLSDYLRRDPTIVQPQIPLIVGAISSQLHRLGEPDNQQWPLRRLLWKCHDRDKLAQAWADLGVNLGVDLPAGARDPLATFDDLRTSETSVYVGVRRCTHGDLNATNIALDDNGGKVDAYIFDAEGIHADVDARDLAVLEVTSLLHHALDDGGSVVKHCVDFYGTFVTPPADLDCTSGPPLVRNTRKLIAEIRRHALKSADESVYAAVVFDVTLQQLGGLAWQRSGNKIIIHRDAAVLAGLAAGWCTRVNGMASSQTTAK